MLPQERRWVLAHTELGCAGLHKLSAETSFLWNETRGIVFCLTSCGHYNMFAYV